MQLQIMLYTWLRKCDDVWIIDNYNFHCFKLIWMVCSNWVRCTELSARWEGDAYFCCVTARAYTLLHCYSYNMLCLLLTRKLNVCFNKWNIAFVNIYIFYHVFITGIFYHFLLLEYWQVCVCVCVCFLCQGLT